MRAIRLLPVFALLVLFGCREPVASPELWGDLELGLHDVGLRLFTIVDSTRADSRADAQTGGRAIEVVLWYPATYAEGTSRLQFQDYLRLLPEFMDNAEPDSLRQWLSVGISGAAQNVATDTLDIILNSLMRASQDALPSPGAFPLVLWTMRHETTVAQSVLSEYLASHGYVVAAARYAGPALPMPWAMETQAEKRSTFATHLQDMTFALERLELGAGIDSSRIAIMTWSYAAELAPRVQMQHSNVKLVIGLSSNPLSTTGLYQGVDAAAHLDVERLVVPYVIMSERLGFNGQELTAPAILAELPTESFYVRFPDLAHGNFNALEGMIPGVFGIASVQPWAVSGPAAQLGYEAICRYTLSFLDDRLTRKSGPGRTDRTWEANLPTGFVTVDRFGASL